MKIQIERSGGFAGIIKTINLETENIPKDIASKLDRLFSETVDTDRHRIIAKKKRMPMPDCYSYKLSAQVGNRIRQVKFAEFDIDKELRAIVNHLFKGQ